MKLKFRLQYSPRKLREKRVDVLSKDLKKAKSIILFTSSQVTHLQLEKLREKFDSVNTKLRFFKNTLFRIAAKNNGLPEELYSDEILNGQIAAIIIYDDDFIPALRAFVDEFRENENVLFKIGLIDNQIYSGNRVITFASIPSRQELYSRLARAVQSPISHFYNSITFDLTRLSIVLKNYSSKLSERG